MASKAQAKKTYQHFVPAAKPVPNWYENYNFVLIENMQQLEQSFTDAGWTPGKSFMSFDTETTGLNFEELDLVGYSYCIDGKSTYYVPVDHFECPINLGEPAVEFIYQRMCEARQVFMYNARYDERVLEARFYKDNKEELDKKRWLYVKYNMSKVNVYDVMNAVFDSDSNDKLPSLKGCFAKGTQIITTNGLKNIEDITTKDKIPMGNHEYKVTGSQCTGIKEVIELEFDDGSIYRCTPDHLFLVKDENDVIQWVQAQNLNENLNIINYHDYVYKNISRHYYNDGVINKKVEDGLSTDGLFEGMVSKTKDEKKQILEKRKQTNLKKYGAEFVTQLESFKNKQKKTFLNNYGYSNPMKSSEFQKKQQVRNKEKYGEDYYFKTGEFKEKSKQTMLNHHGVEYTMQSKEVQEKSKQTCLNKYGVENVSQVEEFKQKKIETCQQNFGVKSPLQSLIVQEKIKQTNLERYGCEYTWQAESTKEKIKQTSLLHYGVDNPIKSFYVQNKAVQTNLEKYGKEYYTQTKNYKEKVKKTNLSKYGVENVSQIKEVQEKVKQTNMKRYDVEWFCLSSKCSNVSSTNSGPNLRFSNKLKDFNIFFTREYHLGRYSYDFKVGNTLIEINPTVTHNIMWSPFGTEHISRITENYHKNKSDVAKEAGYHCIHIFDWDNPEKIIQDLLLPKSRIYACNTSVYGIPKDEVKAFENEHHLHGYCDGQAVCLGLRTKTGELVSLMTFGKPRYNKNYEWELLRYCSSANVIGGAEKLFKYFITNYQPKSILYYCDNSKFSGNMCKNLGFTLVDSGLPLKHWYSRKKSENIQHICNNKEKFSEKTMIDCGYLPVYDCGQSTYIYNVSEG